MKKCLLFIGMPLFVVLLVTSCRKNHPNPINEPTQPNQPEGTKDKNCRLLTFTEWENVDPTQPGSGTIFLERSCIYEQNKLVRINSKRRGEIDGYRTITYNTGDQPIVESFFDKNNNNQSTYKFNYDPVTNRIGSIEIEYRNVNPVVQTRYVYHYDAQNRVDSIASYTGGLFTEYILYTYTKIDGKDKATATCVQRGLSDPTYRLKYAMIEYIYDDTKAPGYWPVFMWDQSHGENLNLVAPNSLNNIRQYIYKSYDRSLSDPSIDLYKYDTTYPSFNAAISHNDYNYVTRYEEKRMGVSFPVVLTYTYDCN